MTQWITFFDKYFLWILLILLTEYIYSVNRMSRKEYIEEYKIESNSIYNNILLK